MSGDEGLEELTCPWCDARIRRGVFVCRGCHADIAYGMTWREIRRALGFGFLIGFGADIVVLGKFHVSDSYFSNILFGLPVGAAIVVALLSWLRLRGKPRFFRRRAL